METFTAGGFEVVTEAVQLRQCGFREVGGMVGHRPVSAVCSVTPPLLDAFQREGSCKDQLALVNNQDNALARSVAWGCCVYNIEANASLPSDILTV